MNTPSPKPTEIAPLREILRKDGVCLCAKCGHLGTGSEFTVSNYPADDYSSCCPKCDNTDEDSLVSAESISDALCAPALAPFEKLADLQGIITQIHRLRTEAMTLRLKLAGRVPVEDEA